MRSLGKTRGSSRYEEKSGMRAKRRYITPPTIIYDPRGWNYPGPDIVGIYQSRGRDNIPSGNLLCINAAHEILKNI